MSAGNLVPFPGLPTAFAATALAGGFVVPLLRRLKVGQQIREQGPQTHLAKAGTPTSGGMMFLFGLALAILIFQRDRVDALLVLGLTWAFGALGAADDWAKVLRHASLGLRARDKLLWGTAIIVAFGLAAQHFAGLGDTVLIPGRGDAISLGIGLLPFLWLVVMGTTNAVNLADGLDGLAAGLGVVAFVAFAIITLHTGPVSLTGFSLAMAGALAAFLIYNVHPARVFMGDSGSLALGAALAGIAILSRTELYLVIVGGVFVLEALSVMAQVLSFKLWHRRILRMSPLHHHFELGGMAQTRVVTLFWVVGLAFASLALVGVR